MARKTRLFGQRIRLGKKLTTGKGWRLHRNGSKRAFKASLIKRFKIGGERIAIFRVLASTKLKKQIEANLKESPGN